MAKGGNAEAVFELMEKISAARWSWDECDQAICEENLPGSAALEDFARGVCMDTGLAPVEPHTIVGSLACGHTNMGLRAIAAGVPVPQAATSLIAEGGCVSFAAVQRRDAFR